MLKIRLIHSHIHAGKNHSAEAVIDVADHDAAWLIDHGHGQSCVNVPHVEPDHSSEPRRKRRSRANHEDFHHAE